MATRVKLSKEFLILYDEQIFCRATDFDFEVNKQTIDITTLCSGDWRDIMVDGIEWRVNFNGLVTRELNATTYSAAVEYNEGDVVKIVGQDYFFRSKTDENEGNNPVTDDGTYWVKIKNSYDGMLQDLKESDTAIEIIIRSDTVGDKFEVGSGFLTSLRMSGSVGDKATFSGTVEGTYELETFEIT